MIPKHSKKMAYTFGTRPPTNWSPRKFLFILEVLEFFVDFLWCLGWQVAKWTMVYWNTWYIWSIFDFSGTWYILKHQHVEATVGASWCADGHRCHDHKKLARGNLQDTTISTRQQVPQLLNQAQPRGRLRFKWQWTSKKYVVWWYGSWYDMMIFFFGRWKRTSSIWFFLWVIFVENKWISCCSKTKRESGCHGRIFADVKVPLCVLILEAHKAAETGELQAVLRESFTKRSADGIPWHCGPGSASKHWEKIR